MLGGVSGISLRPGWKSRWVGMRAHLGSAGNLATGRGAGEAHLDHMVQCLVCHAKGFGL